jgi:RimJ/RimL family protein N-acetyltransferase
MKTFIETERLILRTWKEEDAEPYFQINQDPKVIEFLLGPLTMGQVNDFILEMNKQFYTARSVEAVRSTVSKGCENSEQQTYGLWAVELKKTAELIGFIGLNYTDWKTHFTPAVEVGWRLGSQFWGRGYATEGARAALNYGFIKCGLKEIVSFTVPANARSIRVMEKIGLKRDRQGDFNHPKLPLDHPLSQHILYRITIDEYLQGINGK